MIINNLLFLFFAIKNTLLEKKYAQSILGRFTFTVTVYAFKVSTFLQSSVYKAENRLSNLFEMSIICACVALQIYTESRACHFTFYFRYMQWRPQRFLIIVEFTR